MRDSEVQQIYVNLVRVYLYWGYMYPCSYIKSHLCSIDQGLATYSPWARLSPKGDFI